jgi:hypothetical protein
MNPPNSTPHPRRVVVAGDVTMDWNPARTQPENAGVVWNAENRTETYGELGGAAMVARLIEAVAESLRTDGLGVELDRIRAPEGEILPGDPRLAHSTRCGRSSRADVVSVRRQLVGGGASACCSDRGKEPGPCDRGPRVVVGSAPPPTGGEA